MKLSSFQIEPMSDIFDWDDDEEQKKAEDEVWSAYPLAQPPAMPSSPPEPPQQTALLPAPTPEASSKPSFDDPWNEIDTIIRPRTEPEPGHAAFLPQPEQSQETQRPPAYEPQSQQVYESQPAYEPRQQASEPQAEPWTEYRYEQPVQSGVWSEYPADAPEETARKGGLAMSAGIVFFSSVAFMLFLGWIFDYLFASSPWGLIGGIVLGSIVGFVQFFRISSRIFGPKKADIAERPLMPPDEQHQ